jgi:hypothetical protein
LIAIRNPEATGQLAPTPEQLEVLRRSRFWARWLSLAALLIAALLAASALPPLGHFYMLWVLAGILSLFAGPVFVVGSAMAWHRARRLDHPLARGARTWWTLPWLLLGAGLLAAQQGWPRPLGLRLARPGLAQLAEESRSAAAAQVELPARWVGLWPLDRLRHSSDGSLRCDLLGTDTPGAKRGLYFGATPPPRAQQVPVGTWTADIARDLGGGWHAWYREADL